MRRRLAILTLRLFQSSQRYEGSVAKPQSDKSV